MMRILLFLLIFAFSAPESDAVTLVNDGLRQIKAVQIFNFNPGYSGDLEKYFSELKRTGINTVFFRVFQNKGDRYHFGLESDCETGVYFKTNKACVINDTLADVVSEAKKEGISVFAWMGTRSLSFLKNKYGYSRSFEKGRYKDGYGVNIFNKGVRNHIVELYEDLAAYDIDGILIQDDFILRYNEGFSKEGLQRYFVDTGIKAEAEDLVENRSGSENYKMWSKWKMEQLSGFLSNLRFSVKLINPGIDFAVNIYYETPYYPENGLSWYSQSIERYEELNFSYYAFMAYHEQISKELDITFYESLEYINKSINSFLRYGLDKKQIIVKMQVRSFYNNRKKLSDAELYAVCSLIKNYKGVSFAFVPFELLSDAPDNCFY